MKKTPLRMCISCREMKPKNEFLRVTKMPVGEILFDNNQKLPGRGAYLCKNKNCYDRAVKTKGFSRVFKTQIPEEIFTHIISQIP